MTGFKARSVIGGYWMKVLINKVQNKHKINNRSKLDTIK